MILSACAAACLASAAWGASVPRVVPPFGSAVRALPRGAQLQPLIASLRRDLHPIQGPGFSLIDTRPWLPPATLARLAAELPTEPSQIWLAKNPAQVVVHGKAGFTHLPAKQRKALWAYVDWLTRLVNESLGPDEQVTATMADVRVTTSKGGTDLQEFHTDGTYLTATLALRGRGTLYFADAPKLKPNHRFEKGIEKIYRKMNRRKDFLEPPAGTALIVSADKRAEMIRSVRQTWHSSPPLQTRTVLLIRFSPVSAPGKAGLPQ